MNLKLGTNCWFIANSYPDIIPCRHFSREGGGTERGYLVDEHDCDEKKEMTDELLIIQSFESGMNNNRPSDILLSVVSWLGHGGSDMWVRLSSSYKGRIICLNDDLKGYTKDYGFFCKWKY